MGLITVKVRGDDFEIRRLVELLTKIEYVGTSDKDIVIPVKINGSGRGKITFESMDRYGNDVSKIVRERIENGEPISGDKKNFKIQVDNDNIEDHIIR